MVRYSFWGRDRAQLPHRRFRTQRSRCHLVGRCRRSWHCTAHVSPPLIGSHSRAPPRHRAGNLRRARMRSVPQYLFRNAPPRDYEYAAYSGRPRLLQAAGQRDAIRFVRNTVCVDSVRSWLNPFRSFRWAVWHGCIVENLRREWRRHLVAVIETSGAVWRVPAAVSPQGRVGSETEANRRA